MRLGGPLFDKPESPEAWVASLRRKGFSAAFCPVLPTADGATVAAYATAAAEANIIIAEVGAWSNPISPNEAQRQAALAKCQAGLALAERIGARCCVNVSGSCNPEKWAGPHLLNLRDETFDEIVESVRKIIDAVKPTRTFYTLETMPWIFPDSPENYLRLIKAIDRKAFAVHLDPVNLVNCPSRAFNTTALIKCCFEWLGPYIKSCHAKDIAIRDNLTLHLDECRPGTGLLDYGEFLRGVEHLGPDLPVMLEHLPNEGEYDLAAFHLREVAAREGVKIL